MNLGNPNALYQLGIGDAYANSTWTPERIAQARQAAQVEQINNQTIQANALRQQQAQQEAAQAQAAQQQMVAAYNENLQRMRQSGIGQDLVPIQNYGQLMARRQQAQDAVAQFRAFVAPGLELAQQTGNTELLKAYAEKQRSLGQQLGIPELVAGADLLEKVKFQDKDLFTTVVDMGKPEDRQLMAAMYKKVGLPFNGPQSGVFEVPIRGQLGDSSTYLPGKMTPVKTQMAGGTSPQALRIRAEAERMAAAGEAETPEAAMPLAAEAVKAKDDVEKERLRVADEQRREQAAERRQERSIAAADARMERRLQQVGTGRDRRFDRYIAAVDLDTGKPVMARQHMMDVDDPGYKPNYVDAQTYKTQMPGAVVGLDIVRNINRVADSMPKNLSASEMARVRKAIDPHSWGGISQGIAGMTLNKQEAEFARNLSSLRETIMGLRKIAGIAGVGKDIRDAIQATVPGGLNMDGAYSMDQLKTARDNVEALLGTVPPNVLEYAKKRVKPEGKKHSETPSALDSLRSKYGL